MNVTGKNMEPVRDSPVLYKHRLSVHLCVLYIHSVCSGISVWCVTQFKHSVWQHFYTILLVSEHFSKLDISGWGNKHVHGVFSMHVF